MKRMVILLAVASTIAAVREADAGAPLIGDFNGDGIVSHADYSILGDTYGTVGPAADADFDGMVGQSDFDLYVANYGEMASSPGVLPFEVVATPSGGNLEWTMTFSGVNGSLAGHLNLSTGGPNILSVAGGPGFLDDNDGMLEVPGINASSAVEEGISWSGNTAFAALGATLTNPPTLTGSDSTLEFLRVVTEGTQPTALTYSGAYGYQAEDYGLEGSASFVPEPAAGVLVGLVLLLVSASRKGFGR